MDVLEPILIKKSCIQRIVIWKLPLDLGFFGNFREVFDIDHSVIVIFLNASELVRTNAKIWLMFLSRK